MTLYVEQEPLVIEGQGGSIHLSSDGGETWQAHRTREAFDRWLESIDRQLMGGREYGTADEIERSYAAARADAEARA